MFFLNIFQREAKLVIVNVLFERKKIKTNP